MWDGSVVPDDSGAWFGEVMTDFYLRPRRGRAEGRKKARWWVGGREEATEVSSRPFKPSVAAAPPCSHSSRGRTRSREGKGCHRD